MKMMVISRNGRLAARAASAAFAQLPPRAGGSSITALFSSVANDAKEGGVDAATVDKASQEPQPMTGAKAAAVPAVKKKSSPMQNLKDVMDALDIMIEEAEKKVVKKYRPNMFAEFKQLNDTNGKTVQGPETLVEVSKAVEVPSLKVRSLAGKDVDLQSLVANNGKVTLVLTSFKNFGMNMLPAWREAFDKEFASTSNSKRVQTATLNIIEDWYMKLVQSSITRGLTEKTPAELHELTFAHFGRCDDFRTALDLYNSFTGYVHLVDAKGRIRWIASGEATPEELARLMHVTRQLLEQSAQSRRR